MLQKSMRDKMMLMTKRFRGTYLTPKLPLPLPTLASSAGWSMRRSRRSILRAGDRQET